MAIGCGRGGWAPLRGLRWGSREEKRHIIELHFWVGRLA